MPGKSTHGEIQPRTIRIGLIGDFRGRGSRGPSEATSLLTERRLPRIDHEDLNAVMTRLGPELSLVLSLPGGEPCSVSLTFRELDDFHPDRILARADVLNRLREAKDRLGDSTTSSASVAAEAPASSPSAPGSPPPEDISPEALLDEILGQPAQRPTDDAAKQGPADAALEAFIDRITAPYVSRPDPHQAELIACVEEAMASGLRAILHHPDFRALESLWRGVNLVTRRLASQPGLTLELIDLTRAELEGDLLSTAPIESTSVFKLLVEPSAGTEGGEPWSFLVGDMTFGPSPRDAALLWRLGQIARLAGAPFLSAASPSLVGCASLAMSQDPDEWLPPPQDEGWRALRASGEASYLGLILPRFVLRAPYGPETSPIQTFSFTELIQPPAHESYLWGNPAMAVAVMLGRAFHEEGAFVPEDFNPVLGDLPLSIERDEEGDAVAKPCAEVILGRRAAELMLNRGLMPLLSVRNGDSVHLARLGSISADHAPLALR